MREETALRLTASTRIPCHHLDETRSFQEPGILDFDYSAMPGWGFKIPTPARPDFDKGYRKVVGCATCGDMGAITDPCRYCVAEAEERERYDL